MSGPAAATATATNCRYHWAGGESGCFRSGSVHGSCVVAMEIFSTGDAASCIDHVIGIGFQVGTAE